MQKNEEFIALLKSTVKENRLDIIPNEELFKICNRARSIAAFSNTLDIELSKAINTLLEEIKKRGLSQDSKPQENKPKEIPNYEDSPSAYSDKSFGWGYFWIVMCFLQGGIAFFLGFIGGMTTDMIPNRGVALLLSVLGIGSAVGLLKRKIFGLYLVYVMLALGGLAGIIKIISGTPVDIATGIFIIGIEYLWFRYFQNRKAWFNGAKENGRLAGEKKYHQTNMKKIIENHKTICMILLLSLILVMGALFFRYESEQIGSRLVRYDMDCTPQVGQNMLE